MKCGIHPYATRRAGEIDRGRGEPRAEEGASEAGGDRGHRAFVTHAQKFGSVFLVCLGIWLVSGLGYFWPGWVLLVGMVKLGNHARSVYGRAPAFSDADA